MRKEFWVFLFCAVFFGLISPVYWVTSHEMVGTVAFIMSALLFSMTSFYLFFVSREIPPRPEDRFDGEVADGAGELGFFPPYSWWPFYCGLALAVLMLGIVFGWWLFILTLPIAAMALMGWVFEYYRGTHAH